MFLFFIIIILLLHCKYIYTGFRHFRRATVYNSTEIGIRKQFFFFIFFQAQGRLKT